MGAAGDEESAFLRNHASGEQKYQEIKARFEGHLLRIREAIESLHKELYG